MKSAKTKIVFGVLDLVAAGFAVWFHCDLSRDQTDWLVHTLIFPFLFSVPIALFNLRPLLIRSVGRWELWVCSALALAGLVMPSLSCSYEAWRISYRLLSQELVVITAICIGVATALLVFVYAWHWGIPRRFLCPVALRCSVLPVWGGLAVLVAVESGSSELIYIWISWGIPFVYLTETILYLRTGWKERTPREKI